jgi:acetylornithine deacetylase/succinyl-diaminopimelate desuccinylase-like protein
MDTIPKAIRCSSSNVKADQITQRLRWSALALAVLATAAPAGEAPLDWAKVEAESLQHYQALVRLDTSDPPGNESRVAEYLKQVLDREGIPAQLFEAEPARANLVARLKGNGRKRPVLLMSHEDVVRADPAKWKFPPFAATRDAGYIYGRGTVDDKDNLTAALMTLLLLKRSGITPDRDVILLAEAGEEAATRVGVEYMVREHYPAIEAEYCLAEGGLTVRSAGKVLFTQVQTAEKRPNPVVLTATGTSGHASIPRLDNAVVRLSAAVAALGKWKPPLRLTETTREYFTRLAAISSPDDAARYRALLKPESPQALAAADYLAEHDPTKAAMLRSTLSPTLLTAGLQVNAIPSEAKATIDVRQLPDEDTGAYLELMRKVVNDPAVKVEYNGQNLRPAGTPARVNTEMFAAIEAAVKRNYNAPAIPTMGTGATDMAFLRKQGIQCYGVSAAVDVEDVQLGFGAHSDQERILESELHRFVKFTWDIISPLVRPK